MLSNFFVRDLDSENLLEIFLVSAIFAILGIRFYLHLTGYPQIGGGGLHIAHMLWGGLLMFISLIMILTFVNRDKYWLAALLGGFGFGAFIDELGKFITKDNNYFFEPTIAIIYVIFILIYLGIRVIEHLRPPSQTELLVNVLEIEKQALVAPLSVDRFNKAQSYLLAIDQPVQPNYLTVIQALLNQLKLNTRVENTVIDKLKRLFKSSYESLAKRQFLNWIIIGIFLVQAGIFLYHSFITRDIISDYISSSSDSILSFDELGHVLFSAISGLLVIIGIMRLFKSRLAGFGMFKIAILTNLFLTEFFNFYTNQFEALFGFFFNLFLLVLLNFVIHVEKSKQVKLTDD